MTSIALAQEIYEAFLTTVVKEHVFGSDERERTQAIPDAEKVEIAKGARVDGRTPPLCLISGKGGWSEDPKVFAKRERFTNVTLLDHLVSVTRGALVLAEVGIRSVSPAISETSLKRRLATIAAVAFLHDADKMLGIERAQLLKVDDIELLRGRYGIPQFLFAFGRDFSSQLLLQAIDEVEVSRADRIRPGEAILDRETTADVGFVRLADRLDGSFLDSSKPLRDLAEVFGESRLTAPKIWKEKSWRFIEFSDPHTPFLTDAFLEALCDCCADPETGHGYPPLISVHHDGQFVCVIPEERADVIVDQALDATTRPIGSGMRLRVDVNARGYIDILDAAGTAQDVRDAVDADTLALSKCERLLEVSIKVASDRASEIRALFDPLGFGPNSNFSTHTGARIPLWRLDKASEDFRETHRTSRALNAVLACKDAPKSAVPAYDVREGELIALLKTGNIEVPQWVLDVSDAIDRAPLISALAGAHARPETQLYAEIDALLDLWLVGRDDRQGLNANVPQSGDRLSNAVKRHFKALIGGRYVEPSESDDADHPGRCLFTNQPAGPKNAISTKTHVYGVKVSAFSGRQGRPASFVSTTSETLLAPIAEAEHRLRRHLRASGDKIPVLVSSPTQSGLFSGLVFRQSDELRDLTFYDTMRRIRKDDKPVYEDAEAYRRRQRIGRYEEMPTRLVSVGNDFGQISFLRATFECALRTGRPIHVFRGAPTLKRAFVAFDFLPPTLEMALGGTDFRLEQIRSKVQILDIVELIANETGFGVELACEIANPKTRFGAACDAWSRAAKMPEQKAQQARNIEIKIGNLLKEDCVMSESDSVIVRYAHAMALVQRMPVRSDGDSVAESGFRSALDFTERNPEGHSRDALIAAFSGNLEDNIGRRALHAATYKPENIEKAALAFVDGVWLGLLKGVAPASKVRRTMIATYRWAFTREATRLYLERKVARDSIPPEGVSETEEVSAN
jgi:hypothetical protein